MDPFHGVGHTHIPPHVGSSVVRLERETEKKGIRGNVHVCTRRRTIVGIEWILPN